MENFKRKLFFWLLVASFFVIAPATVLHARGYRFDLNRGVFVYSGSIALKTNPQNFQVSINGKSDDSKQLNRINNSYNITGLLPGDYNIEISQDGYSSWSKKTDVHSGLSNEFWNILLVRDNYERTSYETGDIDRFFISPGNDFIAYTQNIDKQLDVKILSISSEEIERTFSFPDYQIISNAKKENIEWSPEEDYLSIPVEKDAIVENTPAKIKNIPDKANAKMEKQYGYFIVDISNNTSFNLNELLGKTTIRNVRFDPRDQNYVFFLENSDLFRVNILNAGDLTLIASDVSAFDLSSSGIYFITTPNNLVFKSSLDGKSGKNQLTSTFPESGNVIERLIAYDDYRMGFLDTNKNLFIYNKGEKDIYFRKLGDFIEGLHFSNDGKKLLFWSNYEITTYFTRDWKVQPTRNENDLTDITRYSETIRNVQWFKDYENIIFSTGRFIKIIELDGRDRRNCMDLTNVAIETPFVRYDDSLEKLYFTDVKDNNKILESIDFPEAIPLFGLGG